LPDMPGNIDPGGQRQQALAAFLESKVAQGFRIETHTDMHAIVERGPSFWNRLRGGKRSRYVVQVDEHGQVTMRPAEPRRS
jgi:hypothetical protein